MKTVAEMVPAGIAKKGNIWVPNDPRNIPGATIPGLVLSCRVCSRTVPPAEYTKDGLCIGCAVTKACIALREELVRLYKKRAQMVKRFGDPLDHKPGQFNPASRFKSTDDQAERVRLRIIREVNKYTHNDAKVSELVTRQGQLAREAAMVGNRIHLLPFGR